jgi:2-iminobutanoate/2-iminopropanoate deaminase
VEGPFPNQVRQCLENIKTVLEAAGSSLDRVLKCNVFLTDIANFRAMNEVYHTFFPTDPPARSTVAVKDLPGDSPVEIECIAYVE